MGDLMGYDEYNPKGKGSFLGNKPRRRNDDLKLTSPAYDQRSCWQRIADRQRHIAELEKILEPCPWCGVGLGIRNADHSGCAAAIEATP